MRAAAFATVIGAALATATPAAATPFNDIDGTWSGSGQITLTEGRRERISCRAYYNAKDGGSRMALALRCASTSYKIELRTQLNYNNGLVSGSWEERTYHSSGSVTGSARNGRITLRIQGTVSGSVTIAFSRSSQTISIASQGSNFRGAAMSLSR